MEALGWALIGLVSIAWLALFRAVREPGGVEPKRRPPTPESRDRLATRSRRLWLDYKAPTA
jgi:hypothetical protein